MYSVLYTVLKVFILADKKIQNLSNSKEIFMFSGFRCIIFTYVIFFSKIIETIGDFKIVPKVT